MKTYETIVVGIGGMGSATVYNLAKNGRKTLGLERFEIPHSLGSSHGRTKIFRLSQFAGSQYVPLAVRALELWHELEAASGKKVFHRTGGLDCGKEGGDFLNTALKSCTDNNLDHELLNPKELSTRYPAIQLPENYLALFQPDAGFVEPEACITEYVKLAQAHGADIHTGEAMIDWQANGDSVTVTTDKDTYKAASLVFTAGGWAGKVLPLLAPQMRIERAVAAWFQPKRPELFEVGKLPIWIIEDDLGGCYGFPIFGRPGFRCGTFRDPAAEVDPDRVDRVITAADEERVRQYIRKFLPEGAGEMVAAETCLYEFSADEHFIIDKHPSFSNVSFAAGFSSYGFKFCSAVGEIMAKLAAGESKPHSISGLALNRFALATT